MKPISKKNFGDTIGKLKVSRYYRADATSAVDGGDDTHIVRQPATNRFVVRDTSGDWEEELTLSDAENLSAGEFRIIFNDNGTNYRVRKLYQYNCILHDGRRISYDIMDDEGIDKQEA